MTAWPHWLIESLIQADNASDGRLSRALDTTFPEPIPAALRHDTDQQHEGRNARGERFVRVWGVVR